MFGLGKSKAVVGLDIGSSAVKAVELKSAGKGSKVVPSFNFQQGNTYLQSNYSLTIPANKEVAIVQMCPVLFQFFFHGCRRECWCIIPQCQVGFIHRIVETIFDLALQLDPSRG